jgi:hypothetical protein
MPTNQHYLFGSFRLDPVNELESWGDERRHCVYSCFLLRRQFFDQCTGTFEVSGIEL